MLLNKFSGALESHAHHRAPSQIQSHTREKPVKFRLPSFPIALRAAATVDCSDRLSARELVDFYLIELQREKIHRHTEKQKGAKINRISSLVSGSFPPFRFVTGFTRKCSRNDWQSARNYRLLHTTSRESLINEMQTRKKKNTKERSVLRFANRTHDLYTHTCIRSSVSVSKLRVL